MIRRAVQRHKRPDCIPEPVALSLQSEVSPRERERVRRLFPRQLWLLLELDEMDRERICIERSLHESGVVLREQISHGGDPRSVIQNRDTAAEVGDELGGKTQSNK